MVSIPDWSKFGKLHENVKEPTNLLLNKYYKQREEQAIRQAEERGYFRVPTQEYLIEESKKRNDYKYKDVSHLKLIKLCGVHLRKVGEISSCLYLRICIINNNFLTKIDGLMSCHHLVKLDVHSNQVLFSFKVFLLGLNNICRHSESLEKNYIFYCFKLNRLYSIYTCMFK